ncbi:MAG: peptidoglycan-binding domain 1 protein [Rhizobium sp.]|nr:peptidoglycan-binding domain 1 protein [Rhizobium sp.]
MSWISETDDLENRDRLNKDLLPLTNKLMFQVLGNPRGNYSQDCQAVTNLAIRKLIVTEDVGPFRVTGLAPAVDGLRRVFGDIQNELPDIYKALGNAGMLCCRFVRGSNSAISNHSWGCAIDLTLEGKLDFRGDRKAQAGLKAIHPIFNRHEFYWGAAFGTEDAMHFEVSRQLLTKWHDDGVLGGSGLIKDVVDTIDFGDRGPEVGWLQERLNIVMGADLTQDGVFGAGTRAAVIAFQNKHQLKPDGIVGATTREAIKTAQVV